MRKIYKLCTTAYIKTFVQAPGGFFRDFEVTALPVDIARIARSANIRLVKDSDVWVLSPRETGRTVFYGERWTIIYNDGHSPSVSRQIIAHELGHILLGHETTKMTYSEMLSFKRTASSERQADMFAARVLCPAFVIHELGLNSPEEIAEYCMVDIELAKKRWSRMQVLNKRDKFFTDPLEKELYHSFEDYIKKAIEDKSK